MLLTAVRSSMSRTGGEVTLGPPKTNKSRRSVGLTEKATEALRAHLSRQFEEEMECMGSLYHRVGLVLFTLPLSPAGCGSTAVLWSQEKRST